MKSLISKTFAGRSLYALLISVLVTVTAFGQHLVITGAPTLGGTGTYNIKGNITNTVLTTFTGTVTVTMNGAAAQSIGTAGNGAIIFPTLNIAPTAIATTTLNVASTVSTAVTIGAGAINATLAVGANNTLSIGGTSAFGNAGSALSTVATSTVIYNSAGAGQVVLGGFTYTGLLTLTNGTKTLSAATATTVGQAFDASGAGLFTVSGGGLNLGTTGTFGALTNSALIKNGSGLASFGAVTNNVGGTIDGTVGAGALTFGSTVANAGGTIKGGAGALTFGSTVANANGTITGGAGLATFSGLLTQTANGILTSGAGGLTLTAGLTNTLGNITVGAAQAMSVSGNQFTSAGGSLTFNPTSTVTYGASATTIVPSTYGNLTLNTDTKTFPAGVTNVATSLDANSNVIITGTLAMSTAGANATIGGDFANNGTFTAASGAGLVTFDGAAQAIAGTATPTFRNLTLGGTSTKTASTSINISNSLAVNQPLAMSGVTVLTMLNGAPNPSFTGQTEITGSMAWQAPNAAQAYTYHNSATSVTFAVADLGRTFTLISTPGTYPAGNSVGNTVKRSFTASYTGWATGTLAMKLGYLNAEAATVPAVTESKLKDFQNGGIASANKVPGAPTRVPSGAGVFGSVTYPSLTTAQLLPALNNALALDDRFNMFNSIANTAWDVTTTWDAGAVPSLSDDVNIINTHTVTIPNGTIAAALSVTIDGTTANTLIVGTGGALATLNVGAGGLTNSATLGVLTVNTNAIVNITGSNLATGGTITNNGVINVQ